MTESVLDWAESSVLNPAAKYLFVVLDCELTVMSAYVIILRRFLSVICFSTRQLVSIYLRFVIRVVSQPYDFRHAVW